MNSEVSIDSLVVDSNLVQLEEYYGKQKSCAEKYRDKFLAALSFYPELASVEIEVVSKAIRTSMAVRPVNFALNRKQRKYRIYVDDISDKNIDFRKAAYSAQVGCFAHELAHIVYYENRTNMGLIRTAAGYGTSGKFRSRFEKKADQIVIEHGAGYYIYQYSNFIFKEAGISETYRAFKTDNYYTDEELYRLFSEHLKKEMTGNRNQQ